MATVLRYGTKPYGTSVYSGDVSKEFVASNFSAKARGYGRNDITWTRPGGAWTAQRLVRSVVGIPVEESDGEVLLDQPVELASTVYVDKELSVVDVYSGTEVYPGALLYPSVGSASAPRGPIGGISYYYGLFVRDATTGRWRRTAAAEVLATTDYGFTRRLYDNIPAVFRGQDYSALSDVHDDEELTFLYRFLSAFGFQLDHIRTELESLRSANNPRTVSSILLPLLSHQVGLPYEPELGDRLVRRMVASAFHLWGVRGSLAGTRELATTFTGWGSTVRLGYNLALDRLDAGPDGGRGRWTRRANCTTSYRAFTDAAGDRGPGGEGAVVLTSVAAGVMEVGVNPANGQNNPLERLQYATPIIPNLPYTISQYVRSASVGLTTRVGIRWLGTDGQLVGGYPDVYGQTYVGSAPEVFGPEVPVTNDWSTRPSHVLTAPAGARYLEYLLQITGAAAAGVEVRACAMQIEEDFTVSPWVPSREVLVYLQGELRNFVGNTSGYGLSAEGWTGATALRDDNQPNFYYLGFDSAVAAFDPTLALVDAFAVEVVGDTAPQQPGSSYPGYLDGYAGSTVVVERDYDAVYTAGTRVVNDLETWSVIVDSAGLFTTGGVREVQVGFACYDGDTFVRYIWGTTVNIDAAYQSLGLELTVPANADFDRISFAIRSSDLRVVWRNAALENVRLIDTRQFDGSTPSATLDYVWEGVPYRSTSQYYSLRAVRASRLRELLTEYLPHPAQHRLVFATDVIPDSPRASAGSDLDPDDEQTTSVGAQTRSRWAVTRTVPAVLDVAWVIDSRTRTVDLTTSWNVDHIRALADSTWNISAAVGAQVVLRWNTSVVFQDAATAWNIVEQVTVVDAITVS